MSSKSQKNLEASFFFLLPLFLEMIGNIITISRPVIVMVLMISSLISYSRIPPSIDDNSEFVDIKHLPKN